MRPFPACLLANASPTASGITLATTAEDIMCPLSGSAICIEPALPLAVPGLMVEEITKSLGATYGENAIAAMRLAYKSQAIEDESDAFLLDLGLGGLAGVSFFIPVVGPFISGAFALSIVGVETGRYVMAYQEVDDAKKFASSTGYKYVIRTEDDQSNAGSRLRFAVLFAAFDMAAIQAAIP